MITQREKELEDLALLINKIDKKYENREIDFLIFLFFFAKIKTDFVEK